MLLAVFKDRMMSIFFFWIVVVLEVVVSRNEKEINKYLICRPKPFSAATQLINNTNKSNQNITLTRQQKKKSSKQGI